VDCNPASLSLAKQGAGRGREHRERRIRPEVQLEAAARHTLAVRRTAVEGLAEERIAGAVAEARYTAEEVRRNRSGVVHPMTAAEMEVVHPTRLAGAEARPIAVADEAAVHHTGLAVRRTEQEELRPTFVVVAARRKVVAVGRTLWRETTCGKECQLQTGSPGQVIYLVDPPVGGM